MVKNVLTIIVSFILITACKKGNISNSNPINITGTWKGTFNYNRSIPTSTENHTWSINKDGSLILTNNDSRFTTSGTWTIEKRYFCC